MTDRNDWRDKMPAIPLSRGAPVLLNGEPFTILAVVNDREVIACRHAKDLTPTKISQVLTEYKQFQMDLDEPLGFMHALHWAELYCPKNQLTQDYIEHLWKQYRTNCITDEEKYELAFAIGLAIYIN